MHPSLKIILNIQELDMKMIRLMRIKKTRLSELDHIESLRHDLQKQQKDKEVEIVELNKAISGQEAKIIELKSLNPNKLQLRK
jgi:uncharacterized protein